MLVRVDILGKLIFHHMLMIIFFITLKSVRSTRWLESLVNFSNRNNILPKNKSILKEKHKREHLPVNVSRVTVVWLCYLHFTSISQMSPLHFSVSFPVILLFIYFNASLGKTFPAFTWHVVAIPRWTSNHKANIILFFIPFC